MGALAEMYVQGVSTRKVKAVTEELCGHACRPRRSSRDQQDDGRRARRLLQPGAVKEPYPDSYPRRAAHERVRGSGRDHETGRADRDRRRLGGAAQRARGRAGQPRERDELGGLACAG